MADPAFLRNIKTQIQDMQNSIPGKQTTYTNAQNTVNTAVNTAKQDATVMATTSADMRVIPSKQAAIGHKLLTMDANFKAALINALNNNGLRLGGKFTPDMISTDGLLYIEM